MIERLVIVSTCGTSLFTNKRPDTGDVTLDWVAHDHKWIKENSNAAEVDPGRLNRLVENRRSWLMASDKTTRREMSAELNGIESVLERYKPRRIHHILVHSDTALGKATADLVYGALSDQTLLLSAGGLRTDHLASFRAALAELTRNLDELVQSYRLQGWFVVFNLTGGFKSLNGFLQTVAMIFADRCVFQFERAADLMEIPRLPVQLAELDNLREHVETFRRLAVGYPVRLSEAQGVPESLLMEVDGMVTTSVLGDVAWGRHQRTLFAENLYAPLSGKVRIDDSIRRAFARLENAQKVHVNEAIDEFSVHVDHGRPLLKSRTFKPVEGRNVPPQSTHELYAWSDGAAKRLYGHYDGVVFVFDELGNHL